MECIHVYSVCVCFFRDLFSSFCLLSHSNLFSVHLFFVFCCTLCGCLVRFTFFIRIKKGFSKLAEKYFYALLFFKRLSRFFFFQTTSKTYFFRCQIPYLFATFVCQMKWKVAKKKRFFPSYWCYGSEFFFKVSTWIFVLFSSLYEMISCL